jgi:hypothetical protein
MAPKEPKATKDAKPKKEKKTEDKGSKKGTQDKGKTKVAPLQIDTPIIPGVSHPVFLFFDEREVECTHAASVQVEHYLRNVNIFRGFVSFWAGASYQGAVRALWIEAWHHLETSASVNHFADSLRLSLESLLLLRTGNDARDTRTNPAVCPTPSSSTAPCSSNLEVTRSRGDHGVVGGNVCYNVNACD